MNKHIDVSDVLEASDTREAEDATEDTEEAQATEDNPEEALKKLTKRITRRQRLFHLADEATNSIGWGVWIVAIVVAVLFLIPIALGLTSSVVLTESMTGTINKGDIALTVPYDKNSPALQVGDVALITQDDGSQFLHRITEVNDDGTYTTKGDANNKADMFKPTNADIDGTLFNVLKQPVSGVLVLFSVNFKWFGSFGEALFSGNWPAVGGLLVLAPWGFLILALTAFVFWSVIPRILQRIINRANLSAAVEREKIKQAVEGHEESLEEIEPVVEEFKEEKAKKEADEAAFKSAQAKAWDEFDPTAPIYDEPEEVDSNPFTAAYEVESLPEVGVVPEADSVDNFLRQLQQRHGTAGLTSRSSQSDLPVLDASTRTDDTSKHIAQASAFYLEEED